ACIVDQWFLFEITDGETRRDDCFTVEVFVDAREYAEQGRLARAVQADDADLCAVEVGEIDVFENRLLVVKLADADHGINDFVWFSAHNVQIKTSHSKAQRRKESRKENLSFSLRFC